MQQPVCLNDFKMSIPKSRKRAMEDSLANPGRVYWLMDKVHIRILTYDDPEKAKAKLRDGFRILAIYRNGEDIMNTQAAKDEGLLLV